MKLYTEEQVNVAMRLMVDDRATFKQVLEQLTPIEIPSDEEIRKRGWEDADAEDDIAFFVGAIWMKEQILNQNK